MILLLALLAVTLPLCATAFVVQPRKRLHHGVSKPVQRARRRLMQMRVQNTNHMSKDDAWKFVTTSGGSVVVVMVEPFLDQNVGATARAMMNFGVPNLRVVNPQCDIRSDDARGRAVRAEAILDEAEVFPSLKEALKDVERVFATTARARGRLASRVWTPRGQAKEVHRLADQQGYKVAIMFGPETNGLTNEDLTYADEVIQIPANPYFSSLNLAQSVNIILYEIFLERSAHVRETILATDMAGAAHQLDDWTLDTGQDSTRHMRDNDRLATREELSHFFGRLQTIIETTSNPAYEGPRRRQLLFERVRNVLQRGGMTRGEVQSLYGVFNALYEGRDAGERDTEAMKAVVPV
ncbi:unnamed protein product, partial [Vitrella brassicaformis CCMP3155]